MEHYKVISNDKSVRLHAGITILFLLGLIMVSQLVVIYIVDDYKDAMIAHDYAIAGYLSQNGIDNDKLVPAFTSDKTVTDTETGSALLTASGYKESVQTSLMPEVKSFRQKFVLIVLALSIAFSIVLLTMLYLFVLQRDRQLKNADKRLRCFIDGDTSIRLEDGGEDSLSRLFSAVNIMATSLTAHINKEMQNKEFLKDTISDISHQLKTPLAALEMYNEIIMDEKTGNRVVESFTLKNRRELERMENLIQNLLKLAKLDAGTIELEKNVHRLKDFLENVISGFLTRAELEGKYISLQCDETAILCFDEIWLGEAVGNIVKNALDHTAHGDKIEISCSETVIATEITVKDNGAGIHPEDIHYIFKRFYRSRFSKDRQGVGIGLALSKSIVEKHGGTITAQSELGGGTKFCFLFTKLTNL